MSGQLAIFPERMLPYRTGRSNNASRRRKRPTRYASAREQLALSWTTTRQPPIPAFTAPRPATSTQAPRLLEDRLADLRDAFAWMEVEPDPPEAPKPAPVPKLRSVRTRPVARPAPKATRRTRRAQPDGLRGVLVITATGMRAARWGEEWDMEAGLFGEWACE